MHSGPGEGWWIDDRDVLWLSGPAIAVVSAVDGRRTELGVMPAERTGDCAWTTDFLACPTGSTMRLWHFTR